VFVVNSRDFIYVFNVFIMWYSNFVHISNLLFVSFIIKL